MFQQGTPSVPQYSAPRFHGSKYYITEFISKIRIQWYNFCSRCNEGSMNKLNGQTTRFVLPIIILRRAFDAIELQIDAFGGLLPTNGRLVGLFSLNCCYAVAL